MISRFFLLIIEGLTVDYEQAENYTQRVEAFLSTIIDETCMQIPYEDDQCTFYQYVSLYTAKFTSHINDVYTTMFNNLVRGYVRFNRLNARVFAKKEFAPMLRRLANILYNFANQLSKRYPYDLVKQPIETAKKFADIQMKTAKKL